MTFVTMSSLPFLFNVGLSNEIESKVLFLITNAF